MPSFGVCTPVATPPARARPIRSAPGPGAEGGQFCIFVDVHERSGSASVPSRSSTRAQPELARVFCASPSTRRPTIRLRRSDSAGARARRLRRTAPWRSGPGMRPAPELCSSPPTRRSTIRAGRSEPGDPIPRVRAPRDSTDGLRATAPRRHGHELGLVLAPRFNAPTGARRFAPADSRGGFRARRRARSGTECKRGSGAFFASPG